MSFKIIFCDFDGVLNSTRFYIDRHHGRNDAKSRPYPLCELDPEAVKNLNRLIAETKAKVVVSSTWRKNRTVEELQHLLEAVGFKGKIIGKTPDVKGDCHDAGHWDNVLRGNEVYAWMNANKDLLGKSVSDYRDYVILDDDSDFLYWQRNNLIITDGEVGLTKTTAYRAKRILNACD